MLRSNHIYLLGAPPTHPVTPSHDGEDHKLTLRYLQEKISLSWVCSLLFSSLMRLSVSFQNTFGASAPRRQPPRARPFQLATTFALVPLDLFENEGEKKRRGRKAEKRCVAACVRRPRRRAVLASSPTSPRIAICYQNEGFS